MAFAAHPIHIFLLAYSAWNTVECRLTTIPSYSPVS